jgi:hypothetical protein
MPRHVAVIFVHGIFAEGFSYAEPMRAGVLRLLPRELQPYVTFDSVFWAHEVRGRQRTLMQNVRAHADVVDNHLRRFLIEGLGDAAAYQKTRHRENSMYYDVHASIGKVLDRMDVPGRAEQPLVFIGHSLGCHIISSFVWDLNKLKQRTAADIQSEPDEAIRREWKAVQPPDAATSHKGASPFRRLDTLAGLVTLGSNMPLFTFTFGPDRVYPITAAPPGRDLKPAFPGAALPQPLYDKARWLNFYSKRDLLGFPLKPLNPAYSSEQRLHDISVRTETLTSRTVPYWSHLKAHTGYWTNPTVLRETATLIREIAETGS